MTASAPVSQKIVDYNKRVVSPAQQPRPATPFLQTGDHLSRAEFERRYAAMPHVNRAELVEGVVYMPSPVHYQQHARPHGSILGWLFAYAAATPQIHYADNASLRLDYENEVQPDAVLFYDEAHGGQCRVTADDFLEGRPELVVEVSASSASYDLHSKLRVYRRNGVPEYLVLLAQEERALWHVLVDGDYHLLEADEAGVLRSRIFPGLWLHVPHFWAGDLRGLIATLNEGLASVAPASPS